MNTNAAEYIDVAAALRAIWRRRAVVMLCAVVGGAIGISYALLARERFTATTVLMPKDQRSLVGGLGQLSGLASLAGFEFDAGGDTARNIAILKSAGFGRQFVESNGLTTVLLADQWDAVSGEWKERDPLKMPDIRDAVRKFMDDVRSISEDKKSGAVTVRITWENPESAASWANAFVEQINAHCKALALTEAEQRIKYLRDNLQGEAYGVVQETVAKLMEKELQSLLVINGSDDFAFRVVDSAFPPKYRSWPNRPLVSLAGLLAGLISGCVIALYLGAREGGARIEADV